MDGNPLSRFRGRVLRPIRGNRGIALPLALLGLVAASLLVTTALVTSSTEVSLSLAHQDGVRALYASENALEQYVFQRRSEVYLAPPSAPYATLGLRPVHNDGLVPGFLVNAARLHTWLDTIFADPLTTALDTVVQHETFALHAGPSDGRGRSVGAMIRTLRKAPLINISVQAGMTVGGNLTVGGSSTISNGKDNAYGCTADTADYAVQVTDSSTLTIEGNKAQIVGARDTADFGKAEMVSRLLGGLTLQEAAKLARIKFAASELSSISSTEVALAQKPHSRPNGVPRDTVPTEKFNWGCPGKTGDACSTYSDNFKNTIYYPSVAIDAGGKILKLTGDHGQGILIVHNGSLLIEGNFVYEGVVLVEKDLTVKGTGSGSGTKITGAVVSLGTNSNVEDNATGNASITYNECIISAAENAFNAGGPGHAMQRFPNGTEAWAEVIR